MESTLRWRQPRTTPRPGLFATAAVTGLLLGLALTGPSSAVAAEATLTEVVEAVKAEQAEVGAVKVAVEALKVPLETTVTNTHDTKVAVEAVTGAVKAVEPRSISGEPTVKIGNWESAPASSTVEFSAPAKASVQSSTMGASVYLIGALVGFVFLWVLWQFVRPNR